MTYRPSWGLVLAGAGVTVATGCLLARSRPAERPSFILILVDTLRPDYLGAYGFRGGISPAIDRLASESLVYTRCFAPSPWTKPSVASMLTSLPPEVHGVTDHRRTYWAARHGALSLEALADSALTLPETLRAAGYETAGFTANPWLDARFGFAQGFSKYVQADTTRELLARASRWIKNHEGPRPFFVYLHLMDVHAPYSHSEGEVEAVGASPSLGEDRPLTESELQAIPWHLEGRPRLDPRDRRRLRPWKAKYAAGVHVLDRRLAPFLNQLRRGGSLDRSMVILTSDHGEELAEHGAWEHGWTFYDEQLAVPLIVRPAGGLAASRRVDGLVGLLDLMPTMLALAKAPPTPGLGGRPLPGLRLGGNEQGAEALFAWASLRGPRARAVRTARYKMIEDPEGRGTQLYDLAQDPGETRNLAESDPALAEQLSNRLKAHTSTVAEMGAQRPPTTEVGEDVLERLRALGYVR
jgi:arylsulfatase A-like enzyme